MTESQTSALPADTKVMLQKDPVVMAVRKAKGLPEEQPGHRTVVVQRRISLYGREPYIRYVDPVTGLPLPPEIAADPTRAPFVGVPVEVPSAATRFTAGIRRRLTVPMSFLGSARQ